MRHFNELGQARVGIGGSMNEIGYYEGGKWGFIDETGKEVIQVIYNNIDAFTEEGLVKVKLNSETFRKGVSVNNK